MRRTILIIIHAINSGTLSNSGFRARDVNEACNGAIPLKTLHTFLNKHKEYFEKIDWGLYRLREIKIEENHLTQGKLFFLRFKKW